MQSLENTINLVEYNLIKTPTYIKDLIDNLLNK